MKKNKFKTLLGVLAISALIFGAVGCNNNAGDNTDFSSTGKFVSAESVKEGIKITISDNIAFEKDGSGKIKVNGNPIFIKITNQDIDAGRKEYVYPFVTKNQTVLVNLLGNAKVDGADKTTYITETVKCISENGMDYSKYTAAVAPIEKSSMDVKALIGMKEGGKDAMGHEVVLDFKSIDSYYCNFAGTYSIDSSEFSKHSSVFASASLGFNIIKGEKDWSHTEWIGMFDNVDLLSNELVSENILKLPSWLQSKQFPLADVKAYGNKFSACAYPSFVFKGYEDTTFGIEDIWSKEKVFNFVTKLELTDGIWEETVISSGYSSYSSTDSYGYETKGTTEDVITLKVENGNYSILSISKSGDSTTTFSEGSPEDFIKSFEDFIKEIDNKGTSETIRNGLIITHKYTSEADEDIIAKCNSDSRMTYKVEKMLIEVFMTPFCLKNEYTDTYEMEMERETENASFTLKKK